MISDQVREIPVVSALLARYTDAIKGGTTRLNELTLEIDPALILDVCTYLKTDQKYVRLSAITGVDWYPMEPRFEVVYFLHSMERRSERVRLKCRLHGDKPEIASVTSLWVGANWYERETFDLFGIRFLNHPNLTRIMMPDDWDGHPLRRDFPVHGHKYSYKDE
ncbi:MAG TPA: NADH-quinone oxidoreductase subunit C [Bryobacteraceae bacterium]|nr:NADH-quinone oxidoreductase subunit C [Bryobacteraceae bacterium]